MIQRSRRMAPLLLALFILSACAANSERGEMMNYKETKSMVLDILKSEEGQKAMKTAVRKQNSENGEQGMQMLQSPQGQQIQLAVKDVLTDPNYPKILEDMMTDPKFAGDFAKAIQKQNKQLQKDLMKDPEYQSLVINAMKNPEFEKMLIDVLKGPDYRKQTMTAIKESLESPLFRAELMELMQKAMEEQSKPKKQEEEKKNKAD